MARFYGKVGYGVSQEAPSDSGVFVMQITEVNYQGDIVQNTGRQIPGEGLNNDASMTTTISIVADAYAENNFLAIQYVEWAGVLWTVTSVEVQYPRLILHLGSRYNGPTS